MATATSLKLEGPESSAWLYIDSGKPLSFDQKLAQNAPNLFRLPALPETLVEKSETGLWQLHHCEEEAGNNCDTG